jgi:hypothetical protein
MAKAIKNYTTEIPLSKTLAEIQEILSAIGLEQIALQYEKQGSGREPSCIVFTYLFNDTLLAFKLTANVDGVHKALARKNVENKYRTRDHARRVAWRIVKDWVEVEVARFEAGIAEIPEIFFPYLIDQQGETFYRAFGQSANWFLTERK